MPDPDSIRHDSAIVLSGGGALAAYEVGVMWAILSGETAATGYQPLDPGIVTGTSAGALNAAIMVSHLDAGVPQALEYLKHVWLDELAAQPGSGDNGVFRVRAEPISAFSPASAFNPVRGNPLQPLRTFAGDVSSLLGTFVRRGSDFFFSSRSLASRIAQLPDLGAFISTDALPATLRRVIDLDAIGSSPHALRIAATNWTSGTVKIFSNQELSGDTGLLAIQASTAIPGLFRPVVIGEDSYVDGGLIMNTPLRPAIAAGASELHVIYLDPDVRNIPVTAMESTLDVLTQSLAIAFAAMTLRDIEIAALINEDIRLGTAHNDSNQPDSNQSGNAPAGSPSARIAARLRGSSSGPVRTLTIHRYNPRANLGGGLSILDFNRDYIERLIERGFRDGVRHDCELNQCILPPRDAGLMNRPGK